MSTVDKATLLFAPPVVKAPLTALTLLRQGSALRREAPPEVRNGCWLRYNRGRSRCVQPCEPGALEGTAHACRWPPRRRTSPPGENLTGTSTKGRAYLVGEQLQTGPLEGVRQRKYKVGHPDFDVRGNLLTYLFRSTKDPEASLVLEAPAVPR